MRTVPWGMLRRAKVLCDIDAESLLLKLVERWKRKYFLESRCNQCDHAEPMEEVALTDRRRMMLLIDGLAECDRSEK